MPEKVPNEKLLADIQQFRMFDDTFMSAVFDGKIKETEYLIRVILARDDIMVIDSKAQFFVSNLHGRGLRLDIFAKDEQGRAYHFEVERNRERASVQRARFTGAMVDSRLLKKGQEFNEIPDRYTIFITEEDYFEAGLPLYHAENKITELGNRPLGDGSMIVYVNGQYRNTDTPIGQLMHDFSCSRAEDIISPLLRERVRMLKETEGGRQEVCAIIENRITEEKIEMAKEELAIGELTLTQISRAFKLPLAFVEELAKSVQAEQRLVAV